MNGKKNDKAGGRMFLHRLLLFLLVVMLGLGSGTAGFSVYAASQNTIGTSETKKAITDDIKNVSGGRFVKKSGKWKYRLKNGKYAEAGFYRIKRKVYFFDRDGCRVSGWRKINGKKYYFGKANEGWMHCSQWVTDKNRRYYLNKKGVTSYGWKTISGRRYYFTKQGYAICGKRTIKGVTYYFNSEGVLLNTGANLSVSADCAILIEASTGKIIYGKNEYVRHANASTTKIMTCILALENCELSETVTASAYAASQEPTKLYLSAGEKFRLKDLLYSLMVPSHNDTAVAIAEHVSGSVEDFVELMNKKARKIGCTNTHFATPNGLDRDLNHYTTAADLAKIAQYAYKKSTFRTIVNTRAYSFQSLSGRWYSFSTTNRLLGTMSGVTGIKTGYTRKAKHCFCGIIKAKNGKNYISVVLGAPTGENRWIDSQKLLQYAYNLA